MTESKTSFSRYWIISRCLSLPIFKFIYFELRKVLRRSHVTKTMEKESHIDLIVPIIKWATFWIVSKTYTVKGQILSLEYRSEVIWGWKTHF